MWKTTGKPQVEQKTYSIKIKAKELKNDGVLDSQVVAVHATC